MKTLIASAAGIALAAGFAHSACARTLVSLEPNGQRAVVSFRDLDLTRASGAARLLSRINVAARTVCRVETPMTLSREPQRCRAAATEDAVRRLNAPLVTAAAAGTTAQPLQFAAR